ncbi:MAG: CDP-glycerol glycerophosphotransferase family protein [Acidaminococcaceae bacterium]|nr:CDP-glycerol glycerophosphotransferase family protein [Acidaminococcaceae bacterium]
MEFFRYIISKIIKLCLHSFLLFSIKKNKIVFFPINGKYYCNLKYISEFLTNKYKNIEVIWITKKENKSDYPISVEACSRTSMLFLYHWMTAQVVIFNSGCPSYFFKRNSQKYIETWHGGGAYKKIDAVYKNNKSYFQWQRIKSVLNNVDYVISSCKKFTEVFPEDTGIKNVKFLEWGMPRNDIFFLPDEIKYASVKVHNFYKIPPNFKTVLYAPTFRDKEFIEDLDIQAVLDKSKITFQGKFILLLRCHPHLKHNIFNDCELSENIVDVSDYPDMQELLCAADILITDYSSSMWDYSFTYKPCFIYANDLDQYKIERDFHTPVNEWPFTIAISNEELAENILEFDQDKYIEKIKKHHHDLGSFEDGHATEKVAKLINDICSGEMK